MRQNLLYIMLVVVVLIIVLLILLPKKSAPLPKTNAQTLPEDTAAAIQYMPLGDSYTIGEGVREQDRFPNQLTTKYFTLQREQLDDCFDIYLEASKN